VDVGDDLDLEVFHFVVLGLAKCVGVVISNLELMLSFPVVLDSGACGVVAFGVEVVDLGVSDSVAWDLVVWDLGVWDFRVCLLNSFLPGNR